MKVFLIESNQSVRRGLAHRIARSGVADLIGEAAGGPEASAHALRHRPDLVVLGFERLTASQVATIQAVATQPRGPALVAIAGRHERGDVVRALDCGARGFLLREGEPGHLIPSLKAVAAGEVVLASCCVTEVVTELVSRGLALSAGTSPGEAALLSAAERSVVAHLSSGLTTNELLATQLNLSVNTVRAHIASSMRKTGTSSRTALALWGVQHRLHRGVETAPLSSS